VAWAQDGVIEAVETVEGQEGHFVLGVQWHAETLIDEAEQLALFERLVQAAALTEPKLSQADLTTQQSIGEQEAEDSGAHAV